jgi:AraC-like DNA-binding protein
LNNQLKKYFSFKFWLFHLLLVLIGIFFLNFDKTVVFPFTNPSEILVNTFHEDDSIKNSFIDLQKKTPTLVFKYSLNQNIKEPFTGIYFHKANNDSFFDFSSFNQIKIYIKSKKGKRIPFYLTLNESSFTTPNEVFSNLPLFSIINYTKEGWYVLNKNDFEIPSWWLRDYGLKKAEVFDIDYSRVNYLMLYSCQILPPNVVDEIEVKSIQFSNSNTSVYFSIFIILLFYNIVYFVFYKYKKTVVIPYVAQGVTDTNLYKNNNAKIIVDLIGENYALSDISVDWMYQKTKISKREIASIFKVHFNISFKEYLNLIRLTESKRLLKETTLSVSEIAYKVGYNNVTHFNRVFKEKNGISPTEFREE